MHHRCCARPTAEEWSLATFWDEQDVTNAEFQRTFMSCTFPGGQLVRRLEDEMQRANNTVTKVIPSSDAKDDVVMKHFPDLYGYRGRLPEQEDVYYLNAWEFLMLWETCMLPKPQLSSTNITANAPSGRREDMKAPPLTRWRIHPHGRDPGQFEVNPEAEIYFGNKSGI